MTHRMLSEEVIRERSYQIWLSEGRPDGKAVEHWLRAETELENELPARIVSSRSKDLVASRPLISKPPNRQTAGRIAINTRKAAP